MTDYDINFCNSYTDEMLEELVFLMNDSFPTCKFGADYYKWQYMENPMGRVVSFNAYYEGRMVAHYATIPIEMVFDNKVHKGLLSLNTATHTEHRGKGLFVKLASQTYQYAKENGFEYVIGVANANSTHGFLKKLDFYLVSPLEVKVGVGNIYSKYNGKPIYVNWDEESLKWRLSNPFFKYYIKDSSIYGNMDYPLFKTIVARNTKIDSKAEKLPPFNLYIGLGIDKKGGFYFNLPKFIKRSPFNLIFRDLTGGTLPKITKDNIFFQLLDYDVA